jgi:hypothetical protein
MAAAGKIHEVVTGDDALIDVKITRDFEAISSHPAHFRIQGGILVVGQAPGKPPGIYIAETFKQRKPLGVVGFERGPVDHQNGLALNFGVQMLYF